MSFLPICMSSDPNLYSINVNSNILENEIGVLLQHPNAKLPTKVNHTDAGWDLYSIENCVIPPKQRKTVNTGISLEMPDHMAGLIWPRSGLSVKQGLDVLAGVIDAGYRGEIMVCLYNTSFSGVNIQAGDRIAQIIFQEVPRVTMNVLETLGSSQRGDHGFGSSGS
jgi:deoxyuridine 5'-triphosphate nucleotidohydrolase